MARLIRGDRDRRGRLARPGLTPRSCCRRTRPNRCLTAEPDPEPELAPEPDDDTVVLDPPVLDPPVLDPPVLDPPVVAPPVLAPPADEVELGDCEAAVLTETWLGPDRAA